MNVDRRLLGWGVFFILLGGIPLATKAGLLDVQVVREWPLLWPILLIGWGLSLLLRGSQLAVVGGLVSAITFGVMGGGALASGFGGIPFASDCAGTAPAVPFPTRTGELRSSARAELVLNCGILAVSTVGGFGWTLSGSDRDGDGPAIEAGAGTLSIESDTDAGFLSSRGRTTWNLALPTSPALALGVTLNAGDGTIDLAGATISTLSITLNAGSLDLDMARAERAGDVNATVNAGSAVISMPGGDRSVNLSLNAGSLTACLPAGSPLRVEWHGALGSNNLDAAGLVKGDDDTWTSAAYVAGQPHVDLHVQANAGSFDLKLGGTCSA